MQQVLPVLSSRLTIQLLSGFPLRRVKLDASGKRASFLSVVSQGDVKLCVADLSGPQRDAAFAFWE